ncbi:hypothetical protein [Amorphus sp. MBR-141]
MQILRNASRRCKTWSVVAACVVTLSIAAADPAHARALSGQGDTSRADVKRLMIRLETLEAFTREATPVLERLRQTNCSGRNNFLAATGDGEAVVCRKKHP